MSTSSSTSNSTTPTKNTAGYKRYRVLVTANGKTLTRLYGDDLKSLSKTAKSRFQYYLKNGARYADYTICELLSKTSPRRGNWKEVERAHYHPDFEPNPVVAPATASLPQEEDRGEVAVTLSRLDYLLTARIHNNSEPQQTHAALGFIRQAREALDSARQLR
jgi:hypothetical protein